MSLGDGDGDGKLSLENSICLLRSVVGYLYPFSKLLFSSDSLTYLSSTDLKSLIGSKSSGSRVASLSPKEFDPKDQYKEVLEAVKKATGEVKVFRVEGKGTRVEYWVLGVDKTKGRAVGFRAKAVES